MWVVLVLHTCVAFAERWRAIATCSKLHRYTIVRRPCKNKRHRNAVLSVCLSLRPVRPGSAEVR